MIAWAPLMRVRYLVKPFLTYWALYEMMSCALELGVEVYTRR